MQINIVRVACIAGLILLIPLFGNLFIDGWNWGISDFIFAFVLLLCTGLAIDFSARKIANSVYRIIVITFIVLALVLLWVEMATDAVSRTITSFF